jgi:hypothetical protein
MMEYRCDHWRYVIYEKQGDDEPSPSFLAANLLEVEITDE